MCVYIYKLYVQSYVAIAIIYKVQLSLNVKFANN